MKTKLNKLIAILMAFLMVFQMAPVTVLAEGDAQDTPAAVEESVGGIDGQQPDLRLRLVQLFHQVCSYRRLSKNLSECFLSENKNLMLELRYHNHLKSILNRCKFQLFLVH